MKKKHNLNLLSLMPPAIALCFIFLFLRLVFLVVSNSDGAKKYDDPKVASEVIRGEITDRNGMLLSIQTTQGAVYVRVNKVEDKGEVALFLSPYIDMAPDEINERMALYRSYAFIKRGIPYDKSKELRKAIIENGYSGIIECVIYQGRSYPASFHASQLIGFVSAENKGLEGIEYSFDDYLLPYPEINKDVTYGDNIRLSIDIDMQYLLDVQVQSIALKHSPDYVMAMIMGAKDGEVYASTSYPWFDLNKYSLSSEDERLNRTITYTYEPGSVFKVFTLALAMEAGVDVDAEFECTGETHFNVDGQRFRISCHEAHGKVDGKGMIEKSCNCAVAYWALQTDKQYFYDYLRLLGFGSKPDVGLAGVTSGSLKKPEDWSFRSQATMAFGQELSVNALQICKAATAIANGGEMIEPTIVLDIKDPEGHVMYGGAKSKRSRAMSPMTASYILDAMVGATETGTAKKAANDGISIASKTGTAQIINPVTKSYEDGTTLASTLSIVPADDPKYIIYFAVSAPRGSSEWGADVAAPAVGEIVRGLNSQGKLRKSGQNIIQLN